MNQTSYFQNKVALVTGAARGIGRAYGEAFLQQGAAVVVADILASEVANTVAELAAKNGRVLGLTVDVADEQSVQNMFREVDSHFGRLDILINNAAIMLGVEKPFKPFWETSYEEWRRIMDVNVGGIFLCCKHAKPLMEREGGRIVNISSDAIWKGYESQLAYFASKGAVAVMTRNLARELGPLDINVNCIAPGYTLSESVVNSPLMQQVEPAILASCCIKRTQRPEDVAGTAVYLCGPESVCVTGQSIVVNCGAIMP